MDAMNPAKARRVRAGITVAATATVVAVISFCADTPRRPDRYRQLRAAYGADTSAITYREAMAAYRDTLARSLADSFRIVIDRATVRAESYVDSAVGELIERGEFTGESARMVDSVEQRAKGAIDRAMNEVRRGIARVLHRERKSPGKEARP